MRSNGQKVFHGWWIVCGAALALFFGSAPIVLFSFGAFLDSLSKEFYLTRAGVSLAFSAFNTVGFVSIPVTGWLIDTVGARKVVLFCTASFAGLLTCMPAFIHSRSYLYVFFAALGVVGCGIGVMPYATVISAWFDRKRGVALGVAMGGMALGTMIVPFLAQRLIPRYGWRHTYEFFGSIVLFCSLPFIAQVLRNSPATIGVGPDGLRVVTESHPVMDRTGFTWFEARHSKTFWRLAGAFWVAGACLQGCVIHLTEILRMNATWVPFTPTLLLGLSMLIGRVGSGYLADSWFGPKIGTYLFSGVSIAFLLLWTRNTPLAIAAVILIGLAIGAEADLLAYLVGRYFGLRAFGQIFAYGWAGFILAGAMGAYAMGLGFDATKSYASALLACCIAMLLATILAGSLGPYRYSQPRAGQQRHWPNDSPHSSEGKVPDRNQALVEIA